VEPRADPDHEVKWHIHVQIELSSPATGVRISSCVKNKLKITVHLFGNLI